MLEIYELTDADVKSIITDKILRQLPEWFGIPSALTDYVKGVSDKIFYAAFDGECCLGFLAGEIHYGRTGEIFVCGVLPEFHARGIGTALYLRFEQKLLLQNCERVVVKTLSSQRKNEYYYRTRQFYKAQKFDEWLDLPELWGQANPCLLMGKMLKKIEEK
ncbi:MAG: GNAT family N-acetyltransferase [Streptococcaceae bacterium]|nr:GNAT family N-acetyltransferase [Streptococcaceae bacterium]